VSKGLLVNYIRLALGEAQQARVPNQLLGADEPSEDEPSEEEGVNELNAVSTGGLMGHAGPRGGKRKENDR